MTGMTGHDAEIGGHVPPKYAVRRDLHAGLLVPVLPQYRCKGSGLNVLYPSRRHLPLAVSALIDLVVEKLNAWEASSAAPGS